MERLGSENRLRGLKKAAGTAVLAVSLAACGSNNATETQKPTSLPTESPMPTMTFVPSESPLVTPTPTLEVTPTPEATPKPQSPITPLGVYNDIEAYLGGKKHALDKYKKSPVNETQFTNVYNAFMQSPNASYITSPKMIENCLANVPSETACAKLAALGLKAAEATGDPVAIKFAQTAVGYDLTVVLTTPKDIDLFAQMIKSVSSL